MNFEWDEDKRRSNIAKHGLDFWTATLLFDGRAVVSVPAKTSTEQRVLTIGRLEDGKFYTIIWTQRDSARRLISFRRSRHEEERHYSALHGG
jgi:uncharacterized DUF497 family protein